MAAPHLVLYHPLSQHHLPALAHHHHHHHHLLLSHNPHYQPLLPQLPAADQHHAFNASRYVAERAEEQVARLGRQLEENDADDDGDEEEDDVPPLMTPNDHLLHAAQPLDRASWSTAAHAHYLEQAHEPALPNEDEDEDEDEVAGAAGTGTLDQPPRLISAAFLHDARLRKPRPVVAHVTAAAATSSSPPHMDADASSVCSAASVSDTEARLVPVAQPATGTVVRVAKPIRRRATRAARQASSPSDADGAVPASVPPPRPVGRPGRRATGGLTYAHMITEAINSRPDRKMFLCEVYEYLQTHFPSLEQCTEEAWKNSVRHNLSIHSQFRRIEASESERRRIAMQGRSKGAAGFWTVDLPEDASAPPPPRRDQLARAGKRKKLRAKLKRQAEQQRQLALASSSPASSPCPVTPDLAAWTLGGATPDADDALLAGPCAPSPWQYPAAPILAFPPACRPLTTYFDAPLPETHPTAESIAHILVQLAARRS